MRTRALVAASLILVAATGCSSSGEPSDTEIETATEVGGDTAEESADNTVTTASDDPGQGSGNGFCTDYQALADADLETAQLVEPEGLVLVDALARAAPDEISSDVDKFIEAFDTVAEQKAMLDGAEADAFDADGALDAFADDPEFADSFERVLGYAATSCDLATSADDTQDGLDADELTQYLADDPMTAELVQDVRIVVFGDAGIKFFTSLSDADAERLCATTLEYALAIDDEASVSLQSDASSDDGGSEVIVEGDIDGCIRV